jgi:hypothetical protein
MCVLNSSCVWSQVLVNHFVDRGLGNISLQIETSNRFSFWRMHSIFSAQVCGNPGNFFSEAFHVSLHYEVRWRLGYVTGMLLSVRRPNIAFNGGIENHINLMCILMNSVILLIPMSASCHCLSDTLGLRRLTPCPRRFWINSNDYDLCHKIESILNFKKRVSFFNDSSLIFDFIVLCEGSILDSSCTPCFVWSVESASLFGSRKFHFGLMLPRSVSLTKPFYSISKLRNDC